MSEWNDDDCERARSDAQQAGKSASRRNIVAVLAAYWSIYLVAAVSTCLSSGRGCPRCCQVHHRLVARSLRKPGNVVVEFCSFHDWIRGLMDEYEEFSFFLIILYLIIYISYASSDRKQLYLRLFQDLQRNSRIGSAGLG